MKKYDVVVLGGGFAGSAAAIAAARGGARVLLCEQSNCLGGAATNSLVNPFMNYETKIDGKFFPLSRGIFAEIVEKLKNFEYFNGTKGNTFSEESLKLVLMRMAVEAGVELLFRVAFVRAERDGDRVMSVTFVGKSGEFTLEADYFIDASGDADLVYSAGFPTRLGRESDGLCQPMTLCFRVAGVDRSKFDRNAINVLYKELKDEGKFRNPREDVLIFDTIDPTVLHFNTTRVVKMNPTDPYDISRAEIEAREQVFEMFDFLKKNFEAFSDSYVISTGMQTGARESRMTDGEYILTESDIVACRRFDDTVALGNYDIDIHNPEGSGTSHYYFPDGKYYTIPYRSLIPKGAENLLVAGRCIAVDHGAQASIRIMPIVCCIGEAAGTAASLAVKHKKSVNEVDVSKLTNTLIGNGALPEKF